MPDTTTSTLPPTVNLIPQQNPIPQPEIPQSSSKRMLYVVCGLIVLILLAGLLYFALRKTKNSSFMQSTTTQPKPTLPRSKPLGTITNVVTASSLDTQGNAATAASTFVPTQKTIYLVLIVNNPKVGTKFEYIRYLNNKYLDKGILKVTKPNLTNSSFSWTVKLGATHLLGVYRVKVYTDGVFEKESTYTVK